MEQKAAAGVVCRPYIECLYDEVWAGTASYFYGVVSNAGAGMAQSLWLPTIHVAIEIDRGNPSKAIEHLHLDHAWLTEFENAFRTMTPAAMRAMPAIAGMSSFWP